MKKYYARECRPDYFDWEAYWNEDQCKRGNIWIGGNRDFCEMNSDLISGFGSALEEISAAIDMEESENITPALLRKIVKESLDYPFSDEEVSKVVELTDEFMQADSLQELGIYCKLLELIYKEPFETATLRGCSQGDWLNCIYPVAKSAILDYIEAVLFATGTEFQVSENPLESLEELDDTDDTYYIYIEKWRDADIKEALAADIGCSVEELVVVKISGQHTYTEYEYKEI